MPANQSAKPSAGIMNRSDHGSTKRTQSRDWNRVFFIGRSYDRSIGAAGVWRGNMIDTAPKTKQAATGNIHQSAAA